MTEERMSYGPVNTENKLAKALSKAQGEMESAKKDSKNPFFRSSYADLASVIQAIKEPLSNNGLAYTQIITEDDVLVTRLMHESGESIESRMKFTSGKGDMQSKGSAITYARRYTLQAIVGLSAEDDDGNKAVESQKETKTVAKPKAEAPVVTKNDKLKKVKLLAQVKFTDPDEFQAWRVDNGLPELLDKATDKQLLEVYTKLKELPDVNV